MTDASLAARVDRLESIEAIRQLAGKYSPVARHARPGRPREPLRPDIQVGRKGTGRAALKAWWTRPCATSSSGTSHHVGQHIIEFIDPDHAVGVVYSKNEHETGPGG